MNRRMAAKARWRESRLEELVECRDTVNRLRTQQDKLLVALRFYSDLENYRRLKLRPSYGKDAARLNTGPMSVEKDLGKIAREAIAEVKRERLSGEVK